MDMEIRMNFWRTLETTYLIFWSDGERKEVRVKKGEQCVCVIWIIQIPLKNNWDVLNAGLC